MSFFNPNRFNILLAIDGSEESYRGLRYAVRVGRGNDADITLLYVRPVDRTRDMAGLDMRAVRQNMLDWGLELPGMKALEKARSILLETGFMSHDWKAEAALREVSGDPLGDQFVNYTSQTGARITLKLIVRSSVAAGILDECGRYSYDLTIIAMSARGKQTAATIDWATTREVVDDYGGTILLARGIEENHGHLICVVNDDRSIEAARKDAIVATRCNCPVYLLSVAGSEEDRPDAEGAIRRATEALAGEGITVVESTVRIGDPVETIIRQGQPFSVIVMSEPHIKGFQKYFTRSVAREVLRNAHNSVMIVR